MEWVGVEKSGVVWLTWVRESEKHLIAVLEWVWEWRQGKGQQALLKGGVRG